MLISLSWSENHEFWSYFGCSGRKAKAFSCRRHLSGLRTQINDKKGRQHRFKLV